jgi:hypothetical protein
MRHLNRRTFLKILSFSPAIFQAPPILSKEIPLDTKAPLSVPELLSCTYPGKPFLTTGIYSYDPITNITTHWFPADGKLIYNDLKRT